MATNSGMFLTGELRKVTERNGYVSAYVLPADEIKAVEISFRSDDAVAEKVKATPSNTLVSFQLTPPYVGTSKTGRAYLGGMRPKAFFAEG